MSTLDKKFLSAPEFADAIGVHRNTVIYWIKMRFIKAEKKNPFVKRPQYKIPVSELERVRKLNVSA